VRLADLDASIPMLDKPWRLCRLENENGVDLELIGAGTSVEMPLRISFDLLAKDFRKERV
jgi:hypothetical protein